MKSRIICQIARRMFITFVAVAMALAPLLDSDAEASASASTGASLQSEAVALCNQGVMHLLAGQPREALPLLQTAVKTLRSAPEGDLLVRSRCELFLAFLYHSTGEWTNALESYSAALEGAVGNHDPQLQWASLYGLASVYMSGLNDYQRAYELLEQALAITNDDSQQSWTPENIRGIARTVTLSNMGAAKYVWADFGGGGRPDYEKALEHLLAAQASLEDMNQQSADNMLQDSIDSLIDALNLGNRQRLLLQFMLPTLDLDKELNETEALILSILLDQVTLLLQGGSINVEDATNSTLLALVSSTMQAFSRAFEGLLLANIGEVYRAQGNHAEAQHYFEQAVAIAEVEQERSAQIHQGASIDLKAVEIISKLVPMLLNFMVEKDSQESLVWLEETLGMLEAVLHQPAPPIGPILATTTEVLAHSGQGLGYADGE